MNKYLITEYKAYIGRTLNNKILILNLFTFSTKTIYNSFTVSSHILKIPKESNYEITRNTNY